MDISFRNTCNLAYSISTRESIFSEQCALVLSFFDLSKRANRPHVSFHYDFPWPTAGSRTAVPAGGAPLKVVTTGVSFDRPPVTSVRPLSVRPMLMSRREMRLSVTVYTKLPTLSEPTAAAGTGNATQRPGLSSQTSADMPG